MNMTTDTLMKEKEAYETADQWKGCGICEKCRRQNYCKTDCSAHKRYIAYMIKTELARRLLSK